MADNGFQGFHLTALDAQRFDFFANSICHDLAKGDVARRQDDSEFFTAVARHCVHGANTIC